MNIPIQNICKKILDEFDYFSNSQNIDDAIFNSANSLLPGKSYLSLSESLLDESTRKDIISELLRQQQKKEKEGLFCPYEVLADQDQIVGFSFPRSTDSEYMSKVRQVAPEIISVLNALHGLTPDDFEVFCKRLLDLLKADETIRTKHSHDEGIDFLGWISIQENWIRGEKDIIGFRNGFRVLVLGQAKRFSASNPVGVEYVRELVGAAAAFHHDQLAPWESRLQLPRLSLTLLSPIVPMIITTGKASGPAKELARKCGVLIREGSEIALYIALEGVGMDKINTNNGFSLSFNKVKFDKWLRE